MSYENVRFLSMAELMVGAQPCDAVDQVNRDAARDAYPFPPGHDTYLREARAWSELNGKVVGAEGF